MVSVGVIVWLASELMFFAGLFGIYFTVRAQTEGEWPPAPTELDVTYALIFTIILVASSVTCQFGVFAAEKGDVFSLRRWYILTFVMGLAPRSPQSGQGVSIHGSRWCPSAVRL